MKTEAQKLAELKRYAQSEGTPVKEVGKPILHDYAGSNPEFYKISKVGDKKNIDIRKDLSVGEKVTDTRHELVETPLMKSGQSYEKAHETALKLERVELPPASLKSLERLAPYSVEHIHDDGDLTVRRAKTSFVVTTKGQVFKEHKPKHSSQFNSRKHGRIYHTRVGRGNVLSRKPLGRRGK